MSPSLIHEVTTFSTCQWRTLLLQLADSAPGIYIPIVMGGDHSPNSDSSTRRGIQDSALNRRQNGVFLIASTSHISLLSRLHLLTTTRLNTGDYGGKGTLCNDYLRTRGKNLSFLCG